MTTTLSETLPVPVSDLGRLRNATRRWSARNRSSRGAGVNDKLKQGSIRVPEVHADSSTAATVTLHRTRFDCDTMRGEVLRQVLDAPGPHQGIWSLSTWGFTRLMQPSRISEGSQ